MFPPGACILMFRRWFVYFTDRWFRYTAILRDRRDAIDQQRQSYEARLAERDRRIEQLEGDVKIRDRQIEQFIAVQARDRERVLAETATAARKIVDAESNPRFGV